MNNQWTYIIDGKQVTKEEFYNKFSQSRAYEEHGNWRLLEKTSPSGKAMWKCRECGRESVTPDKTCPVGPGPEAESEFRARRIESETKDTG